MNKQHYITELSRLLAFMKDEDKQRVLKNINGMFDEAGTEHESDVIAKLGSPVQLAIQLSRNYTPGMSFSEYSGEAGESEDGSADGAAEEAENAETPAENAPEKAEDAAPEEEAGDEITQEPEAPEAAADEAPMSYAAKKSPAEPKIEPEYKPETHSGAYAMASLIMLTVAGILPLIAILLVLVLASLAVGVCGIASGTVLLYAGTMSLSIIADAFMLFGAAFVCLGIGILFTWLAIWGFISLMRMLCTGIPYAYKSVKGASEK